MNFVIRKNGNFVLFFTTDFIGVPVPGSFLFSDFSKLSECWSSLLSEIGAWSSLFDSYFHDFGLKEGIPFSVPRDSFPLKSTNLQSFIMFHDTVGFFRQVFLRI